MDLPLVEISYTCPNHRSELEPVNAALRCREGCSWPIQDGVPVFTALRPVFLSEWAESTPDLGFFHAIVKKEGFVRRHLLGRSGPVLDLGCGGGWRFLPKVGHTAGIDTSGPALRQAKTVYHQVAQSDFTAIPFHDASFDAVMSMDSLGHVALEEKDRVFEEIYRVLKPGGITVHYIECESHDPIARKARREGVYEALYIHRQGHIGLETPVALFRRFRAHGFHALEERAVYRLLTYSRELGEILSEDLLPQPLLLRLIGRACRALNATPSLGVLRRAVDVALAGLIGVTDRALPAGWAGGALVAYQKPAISLHRE